VHARWHGAWCWDRVAEPLRRKGNTVLTPDRLGFDQVRELVETQPEPVVLVGHSSSGMIIGAIAELVPDRVRLLVYISAFLLSNGMTPPDIAEQDRDSLLRDHLVVDEDHQTIMVSHPERVFFADLDPDDAEWAASMLVPEPLAPPSGPAVDLTEGNFGRIPRVYIECLDDRALSPTAQQTMYTSTSCRHVYRLPTGHSPFLSAPAQLADDLLDAGRFAN
jgi:pimeloyl-ACP methyl ester carboxylesterase